jgi:hypothetical protein
LGAIKPKVLNRIVKIGLGHSDNINNISTLFRHNNKLIKEATHIFYNDLKTN